MNCQEILTMLELYRVQIAKVLGLDASKIEVTSTYSFIIIQAPNLHIQFEVDTASGKLYELYSDDQSIKSKIQSTNWPGLNSESQASKFSEKINTLLATADSIASTAVNCARGDEYRPGNFSKIIYTEERIEL